MATIIYDANIDVAGDVIVSGNVDGRDISADGTKLDGIEALADVTDSANVGAAGAPLISSGSGAPATTPTKLGDVYIDTNGDAYIAVGTTSSADWQISNDGSGSGATNLSYDSATRTVSSSTGTDAVINLAVSGGNAGLQSGSDKAKLDAIEASADVTDATNVAAAGAVMENDSSTISMNFVIDEDNMVSNTATQVPTQQSVKAYADTILSTANNYTDGEITALQGSASTLYDTLGEIQAFIESNDTEIASLVSGKTDKYVTNIGDGALQTFTVTHNLGTVDVLTQVIRNSDNKVINTEVTTSNANAVTIDTNTVPTLDAYRVVVIG